MPYKSSEAEKRYRRQYRLKNRNKFLIYQATYRKKHKSKLLKQQREYRKQHPEKIKETRIKCRQKRLEKELEYSREYAKANREKIRAYQRAYYKKNQKKIREYMKLYKKNYEVKAQRRYPRNLARQSELQKEKVRKLADYYVRAMCKEAFGAATPELIAFKRVSIMIKRRLGLTPIREET